MTEQKAFLVSLTTMGCSLLFAFWQTHSIASLTLCALSFGVGVYFMFVASSLHVTNLNERNHVAPGRGLEKTEAPPPTATLPAPDANATSPNPKIDRAPATMRKAAGTSS